MSRYRLRVWRIDTPRFEYSGRWWISGKSATPLGAPSRRLRRRSR